ncbi:MAG: hypothetical protein H6539_04700 [Bacteroidales bacterium]|nr:hypothetical protein [Bacteroidales bacterium]
MKNQNHGWSENELKQLKKLNTPFKIQQYLDECEYNSTTETRSTRYILNHPRAHCMEGALFAAACLEFNGMPPLVLDLQAHDDDDHVIAVFKADGYWGAIAKSNFTTLRYREPVYKTLRELAMSYFDFYFNTIGDKSLRGYSLPHNLRRFDYMEWRTTMNDLEDIGYYLDKVKHFPLVNAKQIKKLEKATPLLLESSMLGSNPAGLFTPGSKKKTKD